MKEFIEKYKKEYHSYSKEKKRFFKIAFGSLAMITAFNFSYELGEVCGKFLYYITH